MIPKKLHFFWSGGRLSWLRYLTLKSACKWNPDWSIYLWTYPHKKVACEWQCEQQDFQVYKGRDWWLEAKQLPITVCRWQGLNLEKELSPVHLSDLFTWWVLHTHGGFYSDMDILYLQPLNNLDLDHTLIFNLAETDFTIGFLGACPSQPFYADMLQTSIQQVDIERYQSAGIEVVYGKMLPHIRRYVGMGETLIKQIGLEYGGCYNIPKELGVYPWNWENVESIFTQRHSLPSTQLGIHWYGGSKISQEFNRLLSPNTVLSYFNTFTRYAVGL